MSAYDFSTTYVCREDTALHEVLTTAVRRGASDAHVTRDFGDGRPFLRLRCGGVLSEREDAPCDARQMVTELVRLPPRDLTDPALVLIHALTNDAGPERNVSFEAQIDGVTVRGRLAYDAHALGAGPYLVARLLLSRPAAMSS